MELRFNIVYVPGSVRYLRLFALSLLDCADCSFRLVSNGCGPEEMRLLREFCGRNPRLEFLALPYARTVSHYRVLSYLQSQERSAYFCFMDSDVFATGEFLSELVDYLEQHVGVFSCAPAWCTAQDQILPARFQAMLGSHNRTDSGVCLGSSYFAIYDNRVLSRVIRSTGTGFGRYLWGDIPPAIRSELTEMGLQKLLYDTGKVLNLLLLNRGHQLCFKEGTGLKHLGGISFGIVSGDTARERLRLRLRSYEERLIGCLPEGRMRQLLRRTRRGGDVGTGMVRLSREERRVLRVQRKKWAPISRYFADLLECLFEDRSPPPPPHGLDDDTAERIRELGTDIERLYARHGHAL